MKRIRNLLLTLCFLLGGLFLLVPAEAAGTAGREPLARKNIAFVVYDHTGEATASMKEVWKRQVRQAYPRSQFAFLPDPQAAEGANEVLTQFGGDGYPIEKEVMEKIADRTGADVVGILVVRAMDEFYIQPLFYGGWDDDGPDTLLRVISGADIHEEEAPEGGNHRCGPGGPSGKRDPVRPQQPGHDHGGQGTHLSSLGLTKKEVTH